MSRRLERSIVLPASLLGEASSGTSPHVEALAAFLARTRPATPARARVTSGYQRIKGAYLGWVQAWWGLTGGYQVALKAARKTPGLVTLRVYPSSRLEEGVGWLLTPVALASLIASLVVFARAPAPGFSSLGIGLALTGVFAACVLVLSLAPRIAAWGAPLSEADRDRIAETAAAFLERVAAKAEPPPEDAGAPRGEPGDRGGRAPEGP